MGLLRGIIQFTGSFDGLSFYKTRQGPIRVRTTGGFTGEAIRTKPNYERTRENAMEFKHVVATGKLFRLALRSYLQPMCIPYGHNRVVQLFHRIQQFDALHVRGARTVAQGLRSSEGLALLNGFEFDPRHTVANYFLVGYSFLPEVGALVLNAYDSSAIPFPVKSDKARLRFRLLRMDFECLEFQLSEEREITFGRNESIPAATLLTAIPLGSGPLIGVLSLTYYQEVSEQLVPLQESGLRLLV